MNAVLPPTRAAMPPKLKTDEDTVRVQIVAPTSWVERVESFRATQRVNSKMPNASAVIRQLVEEALDARGLRK